MQLKDIFLSIPRSTLETLTNYHILPKNLLLWYDMIRFFDNLDFSEEAQRRRLSKFSRPLSQMGKYYMTADQFQLSDEQVRKVINRLNRYI